MCGILTYNVLYVTLPLFQCLLFIGASFHHVHRIR